jgi:hypothetical protein
MSRAERRRRNRQSRKARLRLGYGEPTLENLLRAARCPDCDSDVTIIEIAPGVHSAQVAHDTTCPWYTDLKQDLS